MDTARKDPEHRRRRLARIAFLLLVLIPFLPEITIFATSVIAHLKGCQPDQKDVCVIGAMPASDIIAAALRVAAGSFIFEIGGVSSIWVFYAAMAGWIIACYVVLSCGWSGVWARLLLGFAVALVYSFLPYFGPLLAIANLVNDNCRPNEGGVGACMMFGSHVGNPRESPVHAAVTMGWLAPIGFVLAFALFAVYAIVVLVRAASTRRSATSV